MTGDGTAPTNIAVSLMNSREHCEHDTFENFGYSDRGSGLCGALRATSKVCLDVDVESYENKSGTLNGD